MCSFYMNQYIKLQVLSALCFLGAYFLSFYFDVYLYFLLKKYTLYLEVFHKRNSTTYSYYSYFFIYRLIRLKDKIYLKKFYKHLML